MFSLIGLVILIGVLFRNWLLELFDRIIRTDKLATMGEMSQLLAHDLKKPMQLVNFALQIIEPKDEDHRIFEEAKKTVKQAQLKIQTMLADFNSSMKPEELKAHKIGVSCNEMYELINNLGLSINPKHRFTLKSDLNHRQDILVDLVTFDRILSNLITNAEEAVNDGGVITIQTRDVKKKIGRLKDYVEIKIHNTGSYLNRSERQKIFTPFYTKGKYNGTGLGLSVVSKFVHQYRGKIACHSSKSEGTEFVLTLPAKSLRM